LDDYESEKEELINDHFPGEVNSSRLLEKCSALLESLPLHPSTSNSSTNTIQSLVNEINKSLGPYVDHQIFEDLVKVLLNCKERFLSQEDISEDSDEDLDNHNRIRESSRSRSHTHTEHKTSMGSWRASTPSLEMVDDDTKGQGVTLQSFAAKMMMRSKK
jgi:hypothetical protein